MTRLKLVLALALALTTAFADASGNVFKRVYRADEKQSYTLSMLSDPIDITIDIDTTVIKVHTSTKRTYAWGDPVFGTDVKFHMYNNMEAGTTRQAALPEDMVASMVENNLFEKFTPKMGSIDFLFLFLALAGSTSDQLAGPEVVALNWGGNEIGFKGTIKVLETHTDDKTKAQITGAFSIQGQDLGVTDLISTYEQVTKTLIRSEGTISFGMKAKVKIDRKAK